MTEPQKAVGSKGPRTAKIVIVGEAPGEQEARAGIPFVGPSGKELDKMLQDAGIDPALCYFTNVTLVRPPDNDIEAWVQRSAKRKKGKNVKKPTPEHWVEYRGWLVEPHVAEDAKRLVEDIKEIAPNVVVCLGNTPFWALAKEGITGKVGTWRGSTLWSDVLDCKIIPAYHPAFILRQWQHRKMTVQDFRRVKSASQSKDLPATNWDFTLSPTYDQACSWLNGVLEKLAQGPVKITCDIEGAQKKIICVGLAVSAKRAICIPIMHKEGFWFPTEQRFIVNCLLTAVLHHPNARVINHNIGFDTQFLVNDLLIYPNIFWDTMIAQNVLWPGTPMNLGYAASMYCSQYRYWKDDSEEFWKAKRISNWEQIWFYNCEDCARTWEVQQAQENVLAARGLRKQFDFLQNTVFRLIRKAMFRGVRVDVKAKREMLAELLDAMARAQARVNFLATRRLDIDSPVQLKTFFYDELKLPKQFNDKKKGEKPSLSCDADALVKLAELEPLVVEIVKWINLYRSYKAGVTVCKAQEEADERWRSSYSLGLVETYRLSSSKNPYGRGLNLTNISSGKDVKELEDE